MSTLSIRLPDDMAERLTQALAEEDARQRFLAARVRGSRERGLRMLEELDQLG